MAYRNIATITPTMANNGEFQTYISAIAAEFAQLGLVQTGDTGQINPATATIPGTNNTAAGYQIWRFDDTLQATNPVFIKIEYGRGIAATVLSMWITVGSGSNGSGTLTGNLSTRLQTGAGGSSTNAHLWLFSGDNNRFIMAGNFYSAAGGQAGRVLFMSVEREVDNAGVPVQVGGGVLITCGVDSGFSGGNARQEVWYAATGTTGLETTPGCQVPIRGNGTDGGDIGFFPQYHCNGGIFLPAGLNNLCYFSASILVNVPVTIPVYGQNHEYYPLGNTFFSVSGGGSRGGPSAGGTLSWLCRYDP